MYQGVDFIVTLIHALLTPDSSLLTFFSSHPLPPLPVKEILRQWFTHTLRQFPFFQLFRDIFLFYLIAHCHHGHGDKAFRYSKGFPDLIDIKTTHLMDHHAHFSCLDS